jgi:hypothetical protein
MFVICNPNLLFIVPHTWYAQHIAEMLNNKVGRAGNRQNARKVVSGEKYCYQNVPIVYDDTSASPYEVIIYG